MSDLDALRRAMQAPPDEQFGALDIDQIMTNGKRIRLRRRAVIGACAVLATAAVLIGVTSFIQPAPQAPPAQQPLPTVSEPVPAPPKAQPVGEVIRTGVMQGDEELVFYFFAINSPDLPKVKFGIAAGRMTSSGYLRGGIANNESRGLPGAAPGFHQIMGGNDDVGDVFTPAFGYYVGPAARIEAKVLGKIVRAKVVPWSENPDIKAFWFAEGLVPDADLLGRPTAYDAMGNRLP